MKNAIPAPIVSIAVAALQPYCPELSPASLIEALKHRNDTPNTPTMKPLTKRQAADALQISIPTIDRYIRAGKLQVVKYSPRLVRITPASVEALLNPAPATTA